MSIRSYYRWALLLPIVLPLVAYGVILLAPRQGDAALYFLYASLWIGGAPYVLFATALLVWSRGRADEEMRRAILLSPIVFTALLMVCLTLFLLVDARLGSNLDFLAVSAGFGLAFGYGYVALAELGRLILRPGPAASAAVPAL
jgi:FtsH-binding integral membrane protein